MGLTYGAFTQEAADAIFAQVGSGLPTCVGTRRYVNKSSGSSTYDGLAPDSAYATVQQAIARAVSGDQIVIAPGSYVEAVTVTTSGLSIVGTGNLGQVSIAPSASNATAVAVTGTAASRTQAVTFINVGMEGNGTGGGFSATGNIRTVRLLASKVEGGAFGVTLESTAAGSVADTKILGCEICWTTSGIKLLVSGGGDPVTQTLIQRNLFHNFTDDGVMNVTTHSADVWVLDNVFANQEDGTEPTQYIDLAVASTTGLVARNVFATTVLAAAKLGIADGVMWAGNQTQAEGAATGGGTAGRPD